jgi:hypothetical protein
MRSLLQFNQHFLEVLGSVEKGPPSPQQRHTPQKIPQKIYGHSRADMTDRYCEYQMKQMKVALGSVVCGVVPFTVQDNRTLLN